MSTEVRTVLRRSVFANYRFMDFTTQGFLAVVGVLVLFFHGDSIKIWPVLVAIHAGALLVIHGLIELSARFPGNKFIALIRDSYPLYMLAGFFREGGELNRMFVPAFLDPFFIRVERAIFGFQPSIEFMNALPYAWVSEVLYIAYFSFYFMIGGVALLLYIFKRDKYFHYVSVVSFIFMSCCFVYIFLPVIGPRIFWDPAAYYPLPADVAPAVAPVFPAAVTSGPFYRLMATLYRGFEAPGCAFPSGHITISIVTVVFSFRYLRRIRWFHLAVAILLGLATVYCRYHYVTDVVAGCVAAAALIPIGDRLYRRIGRGT
jgi:membrane-associated phospholipid phosphatase